MGVKEDRVVAIAAALERSVMSARLLPSRSYSFETTARLLRCKEDELLDAVRLLGKPELVAIVNNELSVGPIDRKRLIDQLPRRRNLERAVTRQVAENNAGFNVEVADASVEAMRRCAVVGDMDGYMQANHRLQAALHEACPDQQAGRALSSLIAEYRRAWCAYNRLRDLTRPTEIRAMLVDAVKRGDAEAACGEVDRFIDYLQVHF